MATVDPVEWNVVGERKRLRSNRNSFGVCACSLTSLNSLSSLNTNNSTPGSGKCSRVFEVVRFASGVSRGGRVCRVRHVGN